MMKNTLMKVLSLVLFLFLATSCKKESKNIDVDHALKIATTQYELLSNAAAEQLDKKQYLPRSIRTDGTTGYINAHDWTSGFFPGSLWYLHRLSGDDLWKKRALEYTLRMDSVKYYTGNHDIGFMIGSSYGNARKISSNQAYDSIIVQAAKSLITRFRPISGVIQSWNKSQKWDCPVIIDNMMNLELLFLATKISGNPIFADIAIQHADNTNKNHFRSDGSSYHVLNYDLDTGQVTARNTHQGFADDSAWSRGQAWGLYGFTVAYRETQNEVYLDRAIKIAEFIMNHPNLPDDAIPYWDFDVESTESTPRDASAAAITAAALLELKQFVSTTKHDQYLSWAKQILSSLTSSDYLAQPGSNNGFLLKHCVGSLPHNSEIDVPLNYADYYFLEALYRYNQLH